MLQQYLKSSQIGPDRDSLDQPNSALLNLDNLQAETPYTATLESVDFSQYDLLNQDASRIDLPVTMQMKSSTQMLHEIDLKKGSELKLDEKNEEEESAAPSDFTGEMGD